MGTCTGRKGLKGPRFPSGSADLRFTGDAQGVRWGRRASQPECNGKSFVVWEGGGRPEREVQTNACSLQDPGGEGWGRWCHSQTPLCFLLRGRGSHGGKWPTASPVTPVPLSFPSQCCPGLPHPHNFCQPATCVAPAGGPWDLTSHQPTFQ